MIVVHNCGMSGGPPIRFAAFLRFCVRLAIIITAMDLSDFYNHGFGWICRHCERELRESSAPGRDALPRFMREGEAESKQPRLASAALARWADKARTTLICPRCGITERVEPS